MEYTRPEGCRAAVVTHKDFVHGRHKLVSQLVCGARSNTVEGVHLMTGEITSEASEKLSQSVGENTSAVLGAMCIGCPNRTMFPPEY